MKINKLFAFGTLLLASLAFTACSDDDDYTAGPQESADKVGAYFTTINAGTQEYDPEEPATFTVELKRLNTKGAVEVPLNVTKNDSSVFEVPATANFADGDSVADVTVNFPKAEIGEQYTLTLDIPTEYQSLYVAKASGMSFTKTVTRVKWDNIGNGIWEGGFFNYVFGLDKLPLLVSIQKTVSTDGTTTRYRFDSPYAYEATAQDEETGAYVGYPYNVADNGTWDNQEHKFVISVKNGKASLANVTLGNDFGYGNFVVGQIAGVLKSNGKVLTENDGYPLGKFTAGKGTPGVIDFPENSLFINLPSQGIYPLAVGSTLYLSTADYLAAQQGTTK